MEKRLVDLLQRDLFSECSKLYTATGANAEIVPCATQIMLRLKELIQTSSLPTQRAEALEQLSRFMQIEPYAEVARKVLCALIAEDAIADRHARLQAVLIFFIHTEPAGKEQACQVLVDLAQQPNFSFEQLLLAAHTLYENRECRVEAQQEAVQMLLTLLQRPDLTFESKINAVWTAYDSKVNRKEVRQQAVPLLLQLAQAANLTVEQSIAVAQALYKCGLGRQRAREMMLELAQSSALTFEQVWQINSAFSWRNMRSKRQVAIQMLLELAQRNHLSTAEAEKIAQALYAYCQSKSADGQQVQRLQRQDIPFGQFLLYMATAILEADEDVGYWEKLQAVNMVMELVQGELVTQQYLKMCWKPLRKDTVDEWEVTGLVELIEKERLPIEVRDALYRVARRAAVEKDEIKV
ncbi:MAG: hypothetical protein NVS4B7_08020 [Ktedonobacteraceae bacterium]